MTIRIAAIEVGHWHAVHDAAYLRHLSAMPDVALVGVHDSDAALAKKRADAVGSPPTFTDYPRMLAETKPDVAEMIRLYTFFLERMKSNPPAPEQLGRLDIARGWIQHVQTVIEHSKKHKSEHHEDEEPHEH